MYSIKTTNAATIKTISDLRNKNPQQLRLIFMSVSNFSTISKLNDVLEFKSLSKLNFIPLVSGILMKSNSCIFITNGSILISFRSFRSVLYSCSFAIGDSPINEEFSDSKYSCFPVLEPVLYFNKMLKLSK